MKSLRRFLCNSVLLLAGASLLSPAKSFAETWGKVEGTQPYIYNMLFPSDNKDKIVVCNSEGPLDLLQDNIELPISGNGCQVSYDRGASFTKTILNNYPVYDIFQSKKDSSKWVASVRNFTRGGILHSNDNGETWNDFFSSDGAHQIVKFASVLTGDNERILGAAVNTNEGFVYSDDNFDTFTNYQGLSVQSRYVAASKVKNNLIFLAGDYTSSGKVFRSHNGGDTWDKESNGLEGLRVLCVFPSSKNAALVFAGVDSVTMDKSSIGKGLYVSQDTGRTWMWHGAAGAQVFDISEHPQSPNLMAIAAGTQGVYLSSTYGLNWENISDGLPNGKSVRKVFIPDWETNSEGAVTFAAVYGEGLYKSIHITSDVNDKTDINLLSINRVYPQPANETAVIDWFHPFGGKADINVTDCMGNNVYSLQGVDFAQGNNSFTWNTAPFASGIYFMNISSANGVSTVKITIAR